MSTFTIIILAHTDFIQFSIKKFKSFYIGLEPAA